MQTLRAPFMDTIMLMQREMGAISELLVTDDLSELAI